MRHLHMQANWCVVYWEMLTVMRNLKHFLRNGKMYAYYLHKMVS